MNITFAFTLIISFAIFYIGAIVYLHDRKNASNQIFFLISIFTVLWSVANYFSVEAAPAYVLFFARLVLLFAIPHIVLFYFFIRNFPNRTLSIPPLEMVIISAIGLCVMSLTQTPFVFSDVNFTKSAIPTPEPGKFIPVFALMVIGTLLLTVIFLIKKYAQASKSDKRHWLVMLIGFAVSYIGLIITNFVIVNTSNDTRFIIYAPAFMLPMIVGTAYSILRYRLLNVKAVATEIFVFAILSISIIQIFASKSGVYLGINIVVFMTNVIFSVGLIRSVLREVEQKERLEKLSLALEDANEKLKDVDKRKTEFLSLASHQLRSPITAIKGYTSMLLEDSYGTVADQQREPISRVFQSSLNLANVVEDLLDVAKIEQGGMKYVVSDIDLEQITSSLSKEFALTAKSKGLELQYENLGASPCIVSIDPVKFRQVILNLLDNSIKYTQTGWVKLSIKKDGKNAIVAISDSGMGMSPETKTKLFGKFVRGEGSKVNAGGSGIGLYLAKEIVEAHKGTVSADSPGLGKGATFTVTIPLKTA